MYCILTYSEDLRINTALPYTSLQEAWREKLAAFATAINEKASVAMEPLIPAGSTITVAK
ncbi:hypothetical protein SARC_17493, partial [Sphaeroforma arctica JP610]